MTKVRYPIQLVARMTGLTPHLIRMWEHRYRAVEPERNPGNRRLYSDEDVERLKLLRDVTRLGHQIGLVAHLPNAELAHLAAQSERIGPETPARAPSKARSLDETDLVEACLAAVRSLDARTLELQLQKALVALGGMGFLQRLVSPLAHKIGEDWRAGTLSACHEHFATALLRGFLTATMRGFGLSENAPLLVVATPTGQIHELGALLAAAQAAQLGWRVTYLGANLPAAEIAGSAAQTRARAVALSMVYPEDDPGMEAELTRLRALLPSDVVLVVGGRALAAYRPIVERIGAIPVTDLARWSDVLDSLRRPAGATRA